MTYAKMTYENSKRPKVLRASKSNTAAGERVYSDTTSGDHIVKLTSSLSRGDITRAPRVSLMTPPSEIPVGEVGLYGS